MCAAVLLGVLSLLNYAASPSTSGGSATREETSSRQLLVALRWPEHPHQTDAASKSSDSMYSYDNLGSSPTDERISSRFRLESPSVVELELDSTSIGTGTQFDWELIHCSLIPDLRENVGVQSNAGEETRIDFTINLDGTYLEGEDIRRVRVDRVPAGSYSLRLTPRSSMPAIESDDGSPSRREGKPPTARLFRVQASDWNFWIAAGVLLIPVMIASVREASKLLKNHSTLPQGDCGTAEGHSDEP
ncbi:MAG: hypothetical protein AAF355_08345 [Myxococcota bacterium]